MFLFQVSPLSSYTTLQLTLIGHSDNRGEGDTDLMLKDKVRYAIKSNLNVGYIKSDTNYFDCGTFDEYKFMLENLNSWKK